MDASLRGQGTKTSLVLSPWLVVFDAGSASGNFKNLKCNILIVIIPINMQDVVLRCITELPYFSSMDWYCNIVLITLNCNVCTIR